MVRLFLLTDCHSLHPSHLEDNHILQRPSKWRSPLRLFTLFLLICCCSVVNHDLYFIVETPIYVSPFPMKANKFSSMTPLSASPPQASEEFGSWLRTRTTYDLGWRRWASSFTATMTLQWYRSCSIYLGKLGKQLLKPVTCSDDQFWPRPIHTTCLKEHQFTLQHLQARIYTNPI